jgi:hypothetical protein
LKHPKDEFPKNLELVAWRPAATLHNLALQRPDVIRRWHAGCRGSEESESSDLPVRPCTRSSADLNPSALLFLVNETVISRLRPPDRSIREIVNKVLFDTGYAPLRRIRCDVSDGVVELTGNVPSFYVNQLAQTAVLRLEQIRGVKNLLRVA